MRKALYIALAVAGALSCSQGTDLAQVADAVIAKAPAYVDYGHYAGTVYTQGLAEYYLETGRHRDEVTAIARDFIDGKKTGYGSFISYSTGGNILPELAVNGWKEALPVVEATAVKMWDEQPRNAEGLMVPPWCELSRNPIFADCVLAATPFFLYAGLALGHQEYIDYAAYMTLKTFEVLRDSDSGLIHQARAVMWMDRGKITDDCWSRGNGWGAMALAALLKDFPKDNPQRKRIEDLCADYFTAVLKYQDADGLWHQEMTWEDSYAEISGTGLLLYGLGRAIEAGVLDRKTALPAFRKGLEGLLLYVDAEGNIAQTCSGCLAWGDGSKEAYAEHEYYTNEPHAFGPVLLALAEAHALGIRRVKTDLGARTAGKIPACHVRMVAERKGDIAWENDRAAFRIYSQEVKDKVSSGIDYWGKRVDYPIIEDWYALNDQGLDYHTDRGQGRDFYAVGKLRGLGGTGVWTAGGLRVPEPYTDYSILEDTPERLRFRLDYPVIEADGHRYKLSETIEMVLGTPFFKKTPVLETDDPEAAVAIGLTDFGKAEERTGEGTLTLFEDLGGDGLLAGAVLADPAGTAGCAQAGSDRLLLVKPSGNTVAYVGVAWGGDIRWRNLPQEWYSLVYGEHAYENLNSLYEQ